MIKMKENKFGLPVKKYVKTKVLKEGDRGPKAYKEIKKTNRKKK